MRFSVENVVAGGLWIALAILVLLSASDFLSTGWFLASNAKVTHAHEILEQLDHLLAEVTDAETGQRGYLITGSPQYLEPYNGAIFRVADTLDALWAGTAGDRAQHERLERLIPLVARRLAILKKTIDVRSTEGFEAALRLVLTDRGKAVMDKVRGLEAEMAAAEQRVLADRSRAARASAQRTIAIVVFGDLVALLVVGSAHAVTVRGLAERKRHVAAVEQARGRAERQAEELGKLAQALDDARRAAQDASYFKSRFLADISHEIRTPMTAILGYTERLSEPNLRPAERAACVETIRRNGDHLLTILNDVLDLSKIEAGKMVVERIACSPFEAATEAAALMRRRAEERGLALEVICRGAVPATITSDPTRLRQILINLLGNAIKFTETGFVRLELSLERRGPRPRLRFEVVDSGIGLAPEEQTAVFDAFAQADASTTRRFGGTGLGLTISKRLADLLGGEIGVRSAPGRGSTFTLAIDPGSLEGVALVEHPPAEAAPVVSVAAEEGRLPVSGRILIVEDGPDTRELLAWHLRAAGAEVTVAENGEAACELAATEQPLDLVLLDVQMPGLDGYATAARLRAEGYRGALIALSADAFAEERCRAAGCDGFATKPIGRRALLETVRAHLPGRPRGDRAPVDAPLVSEVGDDAELGTVLRGFVGRLPERVAAMEKALAARDLESLAVLAHQLSGAAGGYGFPSITEAASALEAAATAQRDVRSRLAALAALCRRARAQRA